jgi:hypothetical protein
MLVCLFLFLISNTSAQDVHQLIGDSPFSTSFELESFWSSEIKENTIGGSHHFDRVNNSKVGVFGRYFELSNSNQGIPRFYNIHFGGSYRHYLENKKSVGMSASLGSSSDKPFKDKRDNTILINATYQQNDRWIFLANYSNNRSFLNNIPLPGFVYLSEQSRASTVMLGFPFNYILKPIFRDQFSIKYIGILPYNHKVRVIYNAQLFKPYIGFEQGPTSFFDSERSSNKMRTFWFEQRAMLGIEKSFGPMLKIDLQLGNAFNREYFSAQSFRRKHYDTQKIKDGIYTSINLRSSF